MEIKMNTSALEKQIEHPLNWIYDHVEKINPQGHTLFHKIGVVKSAAPVPFETFTSLVWIYGDDSLTGYYEPMSDAVKDLHGRKYPETLLRDINKYLGVPILNGHYIPLVDREIINPVGHPWPERGPDIYHPTSGLEGNQLLTPFTDSRGTFELQPIINPLIGIPSAYCYIKVN
jgi:hypothetical protein